MSEKGLSVTAIELTTKEGAEVKLSVEEARALYAQLAALFGRDREDRTVPYPYPVPVPYPVRPYLIPVRWPDRFRPRWQVTCGSPGLTLTDDRSGLAVRYST